MITKIDDEFISNDGIIFVNEDSKNIKLFTESGIVSVDLNKINLDDSETIIHVRLMT